MYSRELGGGRKGGEWRKEEGLEEGGGRWRQVRVRDYEVSGICNK